MSGNCCRSCLGIDGLHTQKNDRGIPNGLDACVRLQLDMVLKIAPFEKQTIAIDCIHMARSADQRHGRAGARQHPAEVTTDGSSTNNRNTFNRHRTFGTFTFYPVPNGPPLSRKPKFLRPRRLKPAPTRTRWELGQQPSRPASTPATAAG